MSGAKNKSAEVGFKTEVTSKYVDLDTYIEADYSMSDTVIS